MLWASGAGDRRIFAAFLQNKKADDTFLRGIACNNCSVKERASCSVKRLYLLMIEISQNEETKGPTARREVLSKADERKTLVKTNVHDTQCE